jgi:signal transduction histidine kinase
VEGDRRIGPDAQVVLYRVAQEALNNIVKHAKAQHAEVYLLRESQRVELQVSDDGRGFEACSTPGGHFGLRIMRERVESIGGVLSIYSELGAGTHLQVIWNDVA